MSNEREELAEVIRGIDGPATLGGLEVAEAILAAGYRKPRTITTIEELDDLGRSAAILASNGVVWVGDGDTNELWASLAEDFHGGPIWVNSDGIELPATVLHEGDSK